MHIRLVLVLLIGSSVLASASPRLHVVDTGRKNAPVVLFLHGGPGHNAVSFETAMIDTLLADGWRVISFDQRGCGRSEAKADPKGYSYDSTIVDVRKILDERKIFRYTIVAHSFGTTLATRLAQVDAPRILGMVLIGGPVSYPQTFRTIRTSLATGKDTVGLGKLDSASVMYASRHFSIAMERGAYKNQHPTVFGIRFTNRVQQDKKLSAWMSDMRPAPMVGFVTNERYSTTDITQELTALNRILPIRALIGAYDGLLDTAHHSLWRKCLGDTNVTIVDSASHSVFVDRPDVIVNTLRALRPLRKLPPLPRTPTMAIDFLALVDMSDPRLSEFRLRSALEDTTLTREDVLEITTVLTRMVGLQQKFSDGHKLLDEIQPEVITASPRVRIRFFLERGRLFNSAGDKQSATQQFAAAISSAEGTGEDFLHVDALHMMGIATTGSESERWNRAALAAIDASGDMRTKGWLGPILNNLGWTYFDAGRYDEALAMFERDIAWREKNGRTEEARIARYSKGRTLRAKGQLDEADRIQRSIVEEMRQEGLYPDGYVYEELAEIALQRGDTTAARPLFKRAYELLNEDVWLRTNEAKRLERLKALGE